MLRRAIALACLALALTAPAGAVAKTTSARVVECKGADAAEGRSATFLGRMRIVPSTDVMMMRFTLLEQFGDEKTHPVVAPELRAWRQSKPGVREFRYRQTVTALQGGGQYRMQVDFRWLDSDGNLVRKAQKTTTPCVQKGPLANLRIAGVSAQRGAGGTAVYVVSLQNAGGLVANDVAVELFVDGAAPDVGHIVSIAPRETREVRITGPVCQRRLRVVVDPEDSIKELLESDNAQSLDCPPFGG